MSQDKTKILLELPVWVVREAKADAARQGVTLKEWWAQAGKDRLPKDVLITEAA